MDRRRFSGALVAPITGAVLGLVGTKKTEAQTSSGGRLLGPPIILTGTGTYTPSSGAMSIYVVAVGAGGGAGGATWTTSGSVTGGGGGGATGAKYYATVSTGYAFYCGLGGAGGAPGAFGAHGGTTVFDGLAVLGGLGSAGAVDGVLVSPGANITDSGASPSGSGWNIYLRGAGGQLGVKNGSFAVAGDGGNNHYGTGGSGRPSNGVSIDASGYGAGGGGANAASSSEVGGSGTNGLILVWEYL